MRLPAISIAAFLLLLAASTAYSRDLSGVHSMALRKTHIMLGG